MVEGPLGIVQLTEVGLLWYGTVDWGGDPFGMVQLTGVGTPLVWYS